MIQLITSTLQLNMEQILDVYEESNLKFGQTYCPEGTPWEQGRAGEENMRQYLYEFLRSEGTALAIYTDGGIISSAARIEPYKDGYLLSGLETIPSLRNCGYGTCLLKGISKLISEPIYSHVHKENFASFAVHKHAGFFVVNDFAKLLDGTVSHSYYLLKHVKK